MAWLFRFLAGDSTIAWSADGRPTGIASIDADLRLLSSDSSPP